MEIYIARAHKPSIHDFAEKTLGMLADQGNYGEMKDRILYTPGIRIESIEPPWWAGRTAKPTEPMGRGGPPPRGPNAELIEKASTLLADVRLLGFYSLEVESKDYQKGLTENDPALRLRLSYLLFMMEAIRREATEVKGLSQ
jgi:hypothetical protein